MGTWVPVPRLARSSVCSSRYLVFHLMWWCLTGWASTCWQSSRTSALSWRGKQSTRWEDGIVILLRRLFCPCFVISIYTHLMHVANSESARAAGRVRPQEGKEEGRQRRGGQDKTRTYLKRQCPMCWLIQLLLPYICSWGVSNRWYRVKLITLVRNMELWTLLWLSGAESAVWAENEWGIKTTNTLQMGQTQWI